MNYAQFSAGIHSALVAISGQVPIVCTLAQHKQLVYIHPSAPSLIQETRYCLTVLAVSIVQGMVGGLPLPLPSCMPLPPFSLYSETCIEQQCVGPKKVAS